MVVHNPKPAWLSDHHIRPRGGGDVVGILAFEAAATMTRLLSLHRSLTDREVLRLRCDTMRSPGVSYLTSTDQPFLLRLACAELLDDLDRSVSAAARLGSRCQSPLLRDLPRVFSALKSGHADPRLVFKHPDRTLRRIHKLVSSTHNLFLEMESLSDLEAAERKLAHRYIHSGPIPKPPPPPPAALTDSLHHDLRSQRQRVRRLEEESIWGQTLDKTVTLMSRAACTAFARICVVFGPHVQGLPPVVVSNEPHSLLRFVPKSRVYPRFTSSSGPLERRRPLAAAAARNANSCPIPSSTEGILGGDDKWRKMLVPPPGTVGSAGLAVRYATMIVQAERMLSVRASAEGMGAEERKEEAATREEVYEMLPAGMRAMVRGKLRDWWREERDEGSVVDGGIAEGWKEAVGRMMGWLAPVARDTLQWQAERNVDRRLRFDPKPRVMALQTLMFADREKTEAAVAVVLVGLSLVGWYDDVRCREASMRI